MDYAEFKSHLATFLWKQNDADLVASLDNLITMGTAELNRVLPIQQRITAALLAPETQDVVLPADFRNMISLTNMDTSLRGGGSTMSNVTKTMLLSERVKTNSAYVSSKYCVEKRTLYLSGPFSADCPGNLMISYRANFPDFATEDASYLADDYLDLYTYTVLSHTAPFLREDERVQMWIALKNSGIASTLDEDKWSVEFGGSPLETKPYRPVPQTRR